MLWKFFLGVVVSFFIVVPVVHAEEFFAKDLKYGAKGDTVSEMQEFLTDEKVYTGPISGSFYSLTRTAVRKFQKREKIKQTGIWDQKTRERVNQILTARLAEEEDGEEGDETEKKSVAEPVWPWLQQPSTPRPPSVPAVTPQPVEQPSRIPAFLKPFVQPIVDLFKPTPSTTPPVSVPIISPPITTPGPPLSTPPVSSTPPISPTGAPCSDSDGYDLFKKGVSSGFTSVTVTTMAWVAGRPESCSSETIIAEQYCQDNILINANTPCPSGFCSDGACVPLVCPDNGFNIGNGNGTCDVRKCYSGCTRDQNHCPIGCQIVCPNNEFNKDAGASYQCNTTRCLNGCTWDANRCPLGCNPVCPNNGFNTGNGGRGCDIRKCPYGCKMDSNFCPSDCVSAGCPDNGYNTGNGSKAFNTSKCSLACKYDNFGCPSDCDTLTCPNNGFNTGNGSSACIGINYAKCYYGCERDANGCPSACTLVCPNNEFNKDAGASYTCNTTLCPAGCTRDANTCPIGCRFLCPSNEFNVVIPFAGKTYSCNTTRCPTGCLTDANNCQTGCKTTTETSATPTATSTAIYTRMRYAVRTFFHILTFPFTQAVKALGF